MNSECLPGFHQWEGCKCTQCGKVRDDNHAWSKNTRICAKCGKSQFEFLLSKIPHQLPNTFDIINQLGVIGGNTSTAMKKGMGSGSILSTQPRWLHTGNLPPETDIWGDMHKNPGSLESLVATLKIPGSYGSSAANAAEALGNLGDPGAVNPLIIALSGDNPDNVRTAAAEALGKLGDTRAVEPLIKALGDIANVRISASIALSALGETKWQGLIKGDDDDFLRIADSRDPRATTIFINALSKYSLKSARKTVAEELGKLGDARAIEPLIKTLADWDTRDSAANALINLGEPTVEPLIKALSHNQTNCIRKTAAELLGKLGDKRAVAPLVEALRDTQEVRITAFNALVMLKDVGAVDFLIKTLSDTYYCQSSSCSTAKNALTALGKLGDPRAVDSLIKALEYQFDDVRKTAAEALIMLGGSAIPPLVNALNGNNLDLCVRAAEVLGRLNDTRAVEPLIKALVNGNMRGGDLRKTSAKALADLGETQWQDFVSGDSGDFLRLGDSRDARVVGPLVKVLSEGFPEFRASAAEALGKLGDQHAVDPLIKALGDNFGNVRKTAAKALADLGETQWQDLIKGDDDDFYRLAASSDPRVVDILIKALKDDSYGRKTGKAAARAMGKLDNSRAVEPLIDALRDHEIFEAASEALVTLGSSHVFKPLINALDMNDKSRRAVVVVLGMLGDQRAVEPLIKALEDSDRDISQVAANALGKLGNPRAVEPLVQSLGIGSFILNRATIGLIGEDPRVINLLIGNLNSSCKLLISSNSARSLINLYKLGKITPSVWQVVEKKVTTPHTDYHSTDCSSTHTDTGFFLPGWDF
jgi:HEAT repeat protein